MRNALRAKNKYCFVDGSLPKPDARSPQESLWIKCNSMVTLACELHDSVVYADTTSEIWKDLEERFLQKNAPITYQLKKNLTTSQQGNLSVVAYFTKLKALWNELQPLIHVPECTCRVAKQFVTMREDKKLHQFLMRFGDVFNNVRSDILRLDPFSNINRAYALTVQEEKHLAIVNTPINVDLYVRAALFANFSKNRSVSNTQTKPKMKCEHCKKPGHTRDCCFELPRYPLN
ncbi:PREDICTED: uncharacterized protein LOC109114921 [Nelumbo nucifera]|uniref:Uncharacterized protein LOC109114921 n=1 Tax=Nelumbo nucifera TaxID=4432 RepID=A0A1U8Q529_NELNU|nr:PREDICTED: uncharacterized protein LOC109114921 [Nelumbo nucifera]